MTYSTSGSQISGTPALSTIATSTTSVGIYPITVNNGTIVDQQVSYVDGELCIFPAPLDVSLGTITIFQGDKPEYSFVYNGFRNGDTEATAIVTPPTVSTTATPHAPAGTYPITISGGEATNYELCPNLATLIIEEVSIKGTDMTKRIAMLPNDWHVNDVAYFSPLVKSSDGREEALVQTFEETVENVGEQMWQEIRDLPNGDYVVEVYANAVYTPDRGFESSVIEGANDVAYVEANGQRIYMEARIGGEPLPWSDVYRINTSVTDGTLRITLVVEKPGTNWHTIQIKRLVLKEQDVMLGDLNDDRSVSITDVVLIVDVIAGSITDEKKVKAADVNQDGNVTITDCVAAIDLIAAQTKGVRMNRASQRFVSSDYISAPMKDNLLTVSLENENRYTAFQMVVTMPEGMTIGKAKIDNQRGSDHQLTVRNLGNGQYLLAGFSVGNSELAGNSGCLLNIITNGQTKGDIVISDIEFATADAEAYHMAPVSISSTATGIYQIENREWKRDDAIFDLQGRQVNQPTHGLYIKNGKLIIVKQKK